jgi:hypothetical protein
MLDARGLEGMDELFKTLDRMGNFGKENRKAVTKIHKAAAKEIQKSVKAVIDPHGGSIFVKRTGNNKGKGGPDYEIKNRTLRNSIKVFKAKGSKFTYLVGPRSQSTFNKKDPGSVIKSDGFFAHIVEEGIMPTIRKGFKGFTGGRGMRSGTSNRGFFARGVAKGFPAAQRKLEEGYSLLFDKILRK